MAPSPVMFNGTSLPSRYMYCFGYRAAHISNYPVRPPVPSPSEPYAIAPSRIPAFTSRVSLLIAPFFLPRRMISATARLARNDRLDVECRGQRMILQMAYHIPFPYRRDVQGPKLPSIPPLEQHALPRRSHQADIRQSKRISRMQKNPCRHTHHVVNHARPRTRLRSTSVLLSFTLRGK